MKHRGKLRPTTALSLMLSLGLSACGGGGGGGGSTSPTTSQVTVSGSVSTATSSTAAAVAPATTAVSNAVVVVTSYDPSGNQIDTQTIPTNLAGRYARNNLILNNGGGFIVITAFKQGFLDYSKRVDYSSPADLNLYAELTNASTVVASTGTITGNISGFSVGIVRYSDGSKELLSGTSLTTARNVAGAITEIMMEIPATTVPTGTTALVTSVKSFDASSDSDAKFFPGDYIDKDGNRLVSLAFDHITINNDQGQNLGALVKAARSTGTLTASSGYDTVIRRYIPPGSKDSLLKDFCDGSANDHALCTSPTLTSQEKAGFNVPVYTYRNATGDWALVGMGTIDTNNDGVITTADTTVNGSLRTAADYRAIAAAGNAYLKINVTNDTFQQSWWSIDYPLALGQPPVQLCLSGTVKDNTGQPVAGVHLTVTDDDTNQSFGPGYAVTNASGVYQLKTTLNAGTSDSADRSAKIHYINPFSGSDTSASVNLANSPNCGTSNITVTKPVMGTIKGKVLTSANPAQPAASLYVYGRTADGSYRDTYTDSAGNFVLSAVINQDVDLYFGNRQTPLLTRRLNTAGQIVDVGSLTLSNEKPYAYGYLETNSVKSGSSTNIYVYANDADGNYPLSYEISSTTASWVKKTGSLNADSSWQKVAVNNLLAGNYPLKLTVKDAKGGSTAFDLGTLDVSSGGNLAPHTTAYLSSTTVDVNQSVSVLAEAYDLDGNPLTWSVVAKTVRDNINDLPETTICSGSASASVTINCRYDAPASSLVADITVRVSDGQVTTSSRTMRLTVGKFSTIDMSIQ